MTGAYATEHVEQPDSQFGWIPPSRDWVPSLRYLLRRDRILSAFAKRSATGSVLEVGCGAGALLVDLSDLGYRCVGLETSAIALAIARRSVSDSGREIQLVAEPGNHWAARFDVLMAFDVLEHIEDDLSALRQWSEWLAPGGQLVLSVPAHQAKWGAGDVWAGHFRRYERDALVEKLQSLNLQIDFVECYGFPLANISELLGDRHYRRELKRRAIDGKANRSEGNALSGVDRYTYRRLLPLMVSLPGRLLLRLGQWLQHRAIRTDWGSGYIVVAHKK